MFIKIFQPGNDLLQHLRSGEKKERVLHVPGEGRLRIPVQSFNERKDLIPDEVKNLPRILILKLGPAHGLSLRGLWENLWHFHLQRFQALVLDLFFIQRTNKHQVSQLLYYSQGLSDSSRPDVGPYFINLILDRTGNHCYLSSKAVFIFWVKMRFISVIFAFLWWFSCCCHYSRHFL